MPGYKTGSQSGTDVHMQHEVLMCTCAKYTQKSEWHSSHHSTCYQLFPIRWHNKTDPITYISPNCMMPIFHELESLYYVAPIEQCFSCQYVEMWRWTASTKYFTIPASCGPQAYCYKRDKILHQKIWTGQKKKKKTFFLTSQWRAIIWTDKCNKYKDSSFITHTC